MASKITLDGEVFEIRAVDNQAGELLDTIHRLNTQLDIAKDLRLRLSGLLSGIEKTMVDETFNSINRATSYVADLFKPCLVASTTTTGAIETARKVTFTLQDGPMVQFNLDQLRSAIQRLDTATIVLLSKEKAASLSVHSPEFDTKGSLPSYEESIFFTQRRSVNLLRRASGSYPTISLAHDRRGSLKTSPSILEDPDQEVLTEVRRESAVPIWLGDEGIHNTQPASLHPSDAHSSDTTSTEGPLSMQSVPAPISPSEKDELEDIGSEPHDLLASPISRLDFQSPSSSAERWFEEVQRSISEISVGRTTTPPRSTKSNGNDTAEPSELGSLLHGTSASSSYVPGATDTKASVSNSRIEQSPAATLKLSNDIKETLAHSAQTLPTVVGRKDEAPTIEIKPPDQSLGSPRIIPRIVSTRRPPVPRGVSHGTSLRRHSGTKTLGDDSLQLHQSPKLHRTPALSNRSASRFDLLDEQAVIAAESIDTDKTEVVHASQTTRDTSPTCGEQTLTWDQIRHLGHQPRDRAHLESEFPEVVEDAQSIPTTSEATAAAAPQLGIRRGGTWAPEPVSTLAPTIPSINSRSRRAQRLEALMSRTVAPVLAPRIDPAGAPEVVPYLTQEPQGLNIILAPDQEIDKPSFGSALESRRADVQGIHPSRSTPTLTPGQPQGRARSQLWRQSQLQKSERLG